VHGFEGNKKDLAMELQGFGSIVSPHRKGFRV
jgi:hypothetical protein